jgi:endonuclease-8
VLETPSYVAVGFRVPVAEVLTDASLQRHPDLQRLGPDLLSDSFDRAEAVRRLRNSGDLAIGEALLRQSLVAGIGNVYKSEVCFLVNVHPRTPVRQIPDSLLGKMMDLAGKLLRANVVPQHLRRTTGRLDPNARLWVYGRQGDPCRKCSTPIQRYLEGQNARPTYFCPRCQAHA